MEQGGEGQEAESGKAIQGQQATQVSSWLGICTHHSFAKVLTGASESASFQRDHSLGAVVAFLLIKLNSVF